MDMNFILSCSTRYLSWPLEDKIHIHVRACNILYLLYQQFLKANIDDEKYALKLGILEMTRQVMWYKKKWDVDFFLLKCLDNKWRLYGEQGCNMGLWLDMNHVATESNSNRQHSS